MDGITFLFDDEKPEKHELTPSQLRIVKDLVAELERENKQPSSYHEDA